jgi:anti-anti-sigma factor
MSVLRIDGDVTIYEAASQCAQVIEALEWTKELQIDLSGVTALDTAGLQLLILAQKTALAQGGSLRLSGYSTAVAEVFDLLHLNAFFAGSQP